VKKVKKTAFRTEKMVFRQDLQD